MNVRARCVFRAVLCAGFALSASSLLAQAELPRVGFEESFDTAEGWYLDGGAPIRAMDAEDGKVTFVTHRGALRATMQRPDWPEWPQAPYEPTTLMHKRYERTVDLSVYRYLVMKLDERGTAVKLFVCGRETPVCYTTGLRVLDLRNVNLEGKHRMGLSIEFLNSSGVGTFDFIRLVRELTDEERRALMPPPLEYPREELTVHPYHRLEALNARAGRERRPHAEGQLVCYEDTASRGRVWKLTDQPGDQAFRSGDTTAGWSGDGRYFNVTGARDGKNVWEPAAGAWRQTMGGGKLSDRPMPQYAAMWESTLHPTVVYGYRTKWHQPDVDFIFHRYDLATGEETEFARFTTEGKYDVRELAQAEKGDKVVVGLRGTFRVWIIDPEAKPPAEVVTPITLPTRLKGIHFAKDDTTLIWFNCYTYEQLQMDLATPQAGQARKVTLGYYTSGGHAGGGGGKTLRHYAGMTTVQPAGLTDWKAGDLVQIFAYYRDPIETDYGRLIDGARWWLTNGTAGDVANQHLLVDGRDCASILRLCGYNTSRNNWSTNTYSIASPDATKVAWVSDQLGDGDVMIVTARTPDSPRNVQTKGMIGGELGIRWDKPERSQETAGYIVYGAPAKGQFSPIARVTDTKWTGKTNDARFLVTTVEWSGLESLPAGPSHPLHLDVWQGERSRTARVVFDGRASATRCVRAFKAADTENEDATVTWRDVDVPKGKTNLWARVRVDRVGTNWEWQQLNDGFEVAGKTVTVRVPEKTLLDKVIVTDDPNYVPRTIDDRFPAPPQVTDAKAEVAPDGAVTLTWTKPKRLDHSHVEIFAGERPDFACANETVVGAVTAPQASRFIDWGLKPGTTVTYKIVAVNGRGLRSEPVSVEAKIPAAGPLVYGQVGVDRARPNPKLETVERAGIELVAPKAIKPADKPDPATFVAMEIPFEVAADGSYAVWVRYSPGYTPRLDVPVAIDDGDEGPWRVRPPYRPMSAMYGGRQVTERIFTDRLHIGARQVFDLTRGKHVLRLKLDPAMPDGQVHAVERIWVTNDPSYRPDGFDPRADFRKRAR